MLRFDGVVFLLGTAMSAPVSLQTIGKADSNARLRARAIPILALVARWRAPWHVAFENQKGRSMILPITLTAAGAAALINIWLAIRVGQKRIAGKVSIGDGGHPPLIARMRAHANFTEYTPYFLILVALIEMAVGTSMWLWAVVGLFLLARVAHGIGMDVVEGQSKLRGIGILVTMLTLAGLAIYALTIPYFSGAKVTATEVIQAG
jgi:uncharacterized protein